MVALAISTMAEPEYVKLVRSLGIDSQPGGPVRQPFLGSSNVYKFGLWMRSGTAEKWGEKHQHQTSDLIKSGDIFNFECLSEK